MYVGIFVCIHICYICIGISYKLLYNCLHRDTVEYCTF